MNTNFSTRIDMAGKRFGRWKVLGFHHLDKHNQAYWTCICECGAFAPVSGNSLRRGNSKSCGCLKPESTRLQRTIPHRLIEGYEHKRCCSCKEWISLGNFSVDNGSWDKLSSQCKFCDSKKRKLKPRNKKYFRDWANTKYKTDINFKIKSCIQARIRGAIKNNYKSASTSELLGCTIAELKSYLETKFLPDMNWKNYGEWHIDHIRPCASFDLSDPIQQKSCFHYSNLQPLWGVDNMSKGAKML